MLKTRTNISQSGAKNKLIQKKKSNDFSDPIGEFILKR